MSEIDHNIENIAKLPLEAVNHIKTIGDNIEDSVGIRGLSVESIISALQYGYIKATPGDAEQSLYFFCTKNICNFVPQDSPLLNDLTDIADILTATEEYAVDHAHDWAVIHRFGLDPHDKDLYVNIMFRSFEHISHKVLQEIVKKEGLANNIDAINLLKRYSQSLSNRKGLLIGLDPSIIRDFEIDLGRKFNDFGYTEDRGERRLLNGRYPFSIIHSIKPLGEYEAKILDKIRGK